MVQDICRSGWHRKSCRCRSVVFHQSQGQTGHARCAATALGFPVPVPFVQEPGFFGFLMDTASTRLLWQFCSCPWPSQFLLWFTAQFWHSEIVVMVGLLPMLVPVLMSCFFPSLAFVSFQTAKKCSILKALKANSLF